MARRAGPAAAGDSTLEVPGRAVRAPSAPLWRATVAAALLAAAVVGWAAVPLATSRGGTKPALIAAIAGAVLSVAQLATSAIPGLQGEHLTGLHERAAERLLAFLRAGAWPEAMLLAVLALEALHRARPWHTAVLAVALLAFLFTVHLGETSAGPAVLRPQLPLLTAGLGLLALSVGAATLPGLPPGSASTLVKVVAISAAVVVAAITVPVTWGARR
jgi:hypothetical protein